MQSRFRSKVMWAAVAAQVISICQLTGIFKNYGLDAGSVGDIIAAVLQVLTLVGVLNNPTDSQSF